MYRRRSMRRRIFIILETSYNWNNPYCGRYMALDEINKRQSFLLGAIICISPIILYIFIDAHDILDCKK